MGRLPVGQPAGRPPRGDAPHDARRDRTPPSQQIPDARIVEWPDAKVFARQDRLNSLLKPGYVPFYRGRAAGSAMPSRAVSASIWRTNCSPSLCVIRRPPRGSAFPT